jgi:hypothetical protein
MRLSTIDILLTVVVVLAMIGSAYLGLKATYKKR